MQENKEFSIQNIKANEDLQREIQQKQELQLAILEHKSKCTQAESKHERERLEKDLIKRQY